MPSGPESLDPSRLRVGRHHDFLIIYFIFLFNFILRLLFFLFLNYCEFFYNIGKNEKY